MSQYFKSIRKWFIVFAIGSSCAGILTLTIGTPPAMHAGQVARPSCIAQVARAESLKSMKAALDNWATCSGTAINRKNLELLAEAEIGSVKTSAVDNESLKTRLCTVNNPLTVCLVPACEPNFAAGLGQTLSLGFQDLKIPFSTLGCRITPTTYTDYTIVSLTTPLCEVIGSSRPYSERLLEVDYHGIQISIYTDPETYADSSSRVCDFALLKSGTNVASRTLNVFTGCEVVQYAEGCEGKGQQTISAANAVRYYGCNIGDPTLMFDGRPTWIFSDIGENIIPKRYEFIRFRTGDSYEYLSRSGISYNVEELFGSTLIDVDNVIFEPNMAMFPIGYPDDVSYLTTTPSNQRNPQLLPDSSHFGTICTPPARP